MMTDLGNSGDAEDTFSQGRIEEVGKYDFGVAYDICVRESMAFVTGNDGVMIFDIGDRNLPRNLSLYETGGTFGVAVLNDLLFACASGRGLVIGDISDPATPVDVSVCLSGKRTNRLTLRDGRAFVSSPGFCSDMLTKGKSTELQVTMNAVSPRICRRVLRYSMSATGAISG